MLDFRIFVILFVVFFFFLTLGNFRILFSQRFKAVMGYLRSQRMSYMNIIPPTLQHPQLTQ